VKPNAATTPSHSPAVSRLRHANPAAAEACYDAGKAMSESRFDRAIRAFREVSARDPEQIEIAGEARPKELVHSEWLVQWVERIEPAASEALRLAAHCQHIGRYLVPRATYPEGRIGYLKWRTDLAKTHATRSAEILRGAGYDTATIDAVRLINLKQGLLRNPEVQVMEDALCLTFLEHEFAEFAGKHDDQKLIEILVKTWRKMSAHGREFALALPLSGRPAALVARALSGEEPVPGAAP
jgi:hypothetical protein